MLTPLTFPIFKQRDPRYASQHLGDPNQNPGVTLGSYGCGISCIAMMQGAFEPGRILTPAQVDDIFTDNGGYANGDLIIWSAIKRMLPNVVECGYDGCRFSPAPIAKIKAHIDNGGLVMLQVGMGGAQWDKNGNQINMHWVLGDGYNDDNIIKCDPWYGDETDFTSTNSQGHPRYGTGVAATDIVGVHYFLDGVPAVPVADPGPVVAKLSAENPVPIEATVPNPRVDPAPEPAPVPEAAPPASTTPEWVTTYRELVGEREVKREGAVVVNVQTGEPIEASRPNLTAGKTFAYQGFFDSGGITYATSKYAHDNSLPNGFDTANFDEPGPVSPSPHVLDLRETVADTVSVWQKLKELFAAIAAKFINPKRGA